MGYGKVSRADRIILWPVQSHMLLAPSPRCVFWTQEPHLTRVLLLSDSRTPYSQISQSDHWSKPPQQLPGVPSDVWQLRSTGHHLSCHTLCRHTPVTWRSTGGLQTPEKSVLSFQFNTFDSKGAFGAGGPVWNCWDETKGGKFLWIRGLLLSISTVILVSRTTLCESCLPQLSC